MKKLSVFIVISVLVFFSCRSVATFDESISEEKTTRIFTGGIGTVTEYNGIPVNWERVRSLKFTLQQIPAGDTLLQIDVDAELSVIYSANSTSRVILKADGALFKYNFQPQKEYFFDADMKNSEYGLNIYVWNYGDKNSGSGTPKDYANHFVAFVPFLNIQKSNDSDKKVLN